MIQEFPCIACPLGCVLRVEHREGTALQVRGFRCARGEAYAHEELFSPRRILTTSVKVEGGDYPVVSVRTDRPIPKELMRAMVEELRKFVVQAPVSLGQVLWADALGTGANVVATRAVRRVHETSVRSSGRADC